MRVSRYDAMAGIAHTMSSLEEDAALLMPELEYEPMTERQEDGMRWWDGVALLALRFRLVGLYWHIQDWQERRGYARRIRLFPTIRPGVGGIVRFHMDPDHVATYLSMPRETGVGAISLDTLEGAVEKHYANL